MTGHQTWETAEGAAALVNAVGLHARPSVKLTQLARTFACRVELSLSPEGPWVDAKSPVKVMRVAASRGATLHVRAAGAGAGAAAQALLELIHSGFGEAPDLEHHPTKQDHLSDKDARQNNRLELSSDPLQSEKALARKAMNG